jgi:phosphonate transport system substrate-binding protein
MLSAPPAVAAITQPMTFGVLPYKGPQRLLSDLTPLTDVLSQVAGRPVSLQTARDYAEFLRRTAAGGYDILLTAPHFARLAEIESHYQPIAMTGYQVQAVVLVPTNSPAQSLADLQGKVIGMPQPEAMIYQLGLDLLRRQGLEPGRNITLRGFATNHLAMAAPLRGDADATVGGMLLWRTSGLGQEMRVLAESKPAPGLILMVHSRVPQLTAQGLRQAVLELHKTREGAAYLETSGHLGWHPIAPETMRSLDTYIHFIPR